MTSKQKLSFLSGSLVFPDPLVIIVLNHMYFANIIPLVVYGIVVICMLVVTIPSIVVLDRKLRRLHDADTVNKAAVVVADEAVNNV